MVAFYSQEDQDIYKNNQFMPQSKYLLNAPTFNTPTVEEEKITESFGIPYTNAFTGSGGGGGGGGGYGLFGDLDKSTEKIFNKNVWSGTEWVNKPVKGYMTPSGYKTYEGKNINHAGINFQPMFAHVLGLTKKGPQIGDIEGTFTHGWDSGKDKIKEGWEDEKDKWKGILGINKMKSFFKNKKQQIELQKEIDAANLKAAQDARAAGGPSYRNIASGDMGSDGQTPGGRGGNVTTTGGDTYGGATRGGYNEAAEKTDFYAKGGRAGYFFGGRAGFAKGGKGRQDPMGGHAHQTAQEMREAAPDQFGGGMNINQGSDNTGGITEIITNNAGGSNLIDTSNIKSMSPEVSFNYTPAEWAVIRGRIFNTNLEDNDNIETEANISGDLGNFNYDINLDQEGNKNYNLGYENNIKGYDLAANTDLNNTNFSVGKNGYNVTGSTGEGGNNIGLSKTWSWGQEPQKTINRTSYEQENPDLIYGQNLRYGGLARLL
jgi:hypothetical protein